MAFNLEAQPLRVTVGKTRSFSRVVIVVADAAGESARTTLTMGEALEVVRSGRVRLADVHDSEDRQSWMKIFDDIEREAKDLASDTVSPFTRESGLAASDRPSDADLKWLWGDYWEIARRRVV